MPIDVAMQEPWTRIISNKSKRNIIAWVSDTNNVAFNWVDVVGDVASCATNDGEGVLC